MLLGGLANPGFKLDKSLSPYIVEAFRRLLARRQIRKPDPAEIIRASPLILE